LYSRPVFTVTEKRNSFGEKAKVEIS